MYKAHPSFLFFNPLLL